ncbi:MAG: hypothetical protein QY326_05545 [Bdellovibrionota bacterium]|nr:MAG: hypothetical protein QY326_05545 [Bdellovibrionota bacterium]
MKSQTFLLSDVRLITTQRPSTKIPLPVALFAELSEKVRARASK